MYLKHTKIILNSNSFKRAVLLIRKDQLRQWAASCPERQSMDLKSDGESTITEYWAPQRENTLFQFPATNLGNHQQAKTADFNCSDWYTGRMTISKVNSLLPPNQSKKVDIPWHIHESTREATEFKRRDE